MKPLPIVWQRLVSSEGKTCDRCSATYQEMQRALRKLEEALRPLGIEPSLDVREIDEKAFKATPLRPIAFGSEASPWRNGLVRASEAVVAAQSAVTRTAEQLR